MNKKLLAVAIASAFIAPAAMADTSNVVIGGQMHFSVDSLNGANAAGTGMNRQTNVSSNASNIFFKGSEDLGNGLSAIFQIQTYFSSGGTGSADASFGATKDGVGSGNTFAGVQGGFGTVILGKNESAFKLLSRKVDMFNNQIGDSRNLTSKVAPAATLTQSLGWDLRPNNVIQYATPSFSGFQGNLGYQTNTDAGYATDKSVTSLTATGTYTNGPIYAGLGYEKHNLSNLGIASLNDEKAWRLSGGYDFNIVKVVGFYQRENSLFMTAANNNADRSTYGLGVAGKITGNNTLKAQYYRTNDVSNTSNTSANLWALGFDHAMSKRTTLYAAYARTNNNTNVNYSAFGGGHGDNPGGAGAALVGQDPSGFSLGMIHNF